MTKKDITLIYNLYKFQGLTGWRIAKVKYIKFGKNRIYKLIKFIKKLELYDIDRPRYHNIDDMWNS